MLMKDDIRSTGPRRQFPYTDPLPRQSTIQHIDTQPFGMADVDTVDEQKLEREFGPPADGSAARVPRLKRPIQKLLPALTRRPSHKRVLLLCGIGLIVVGIAGVSSYLYLQHYKPTMVTIIPFKKPPPPKPTTVASTLTGLQVDPSVNDRPVTAVMIENSLDARPQSGLDQAGVVFEALAEGGVTRFMALYQDTQPDYIGPVRSARPYYIQWLLGFDASYAHVGGSPDALQDISSWNVKDLNQFYNPAAYERISSRYAPHNVYTSIAQLNQVEASKGYTKSNYTGFVRKQEAPSKAPTATSIDLTFSGYYYNAHFDYDAATNTYKRSESGQPHMELHKDGTQVQIAPKVVVAMIVPEQNGVLDSTGAYYANYASIGSGQIVVFQDGTVEPGTWSKAANTAPLIFTDTQGKPLALDVGQTWISAVTTAGSVSYK